ncbi:MAG: glycosyltransferase [bacterium]
MNKVYILTNTLKNGGAEKQAVLLAKSLMERFDTKIIVYYGDQYDQKLINIVKSYNIPVCYLHGNIFTKLFKIYNIIKINKESFLFSYLYTTNVINAVLGKIARVKFCVGGIRNAKLKPRKVFFQKFIHNNILCCSIVNNHKALFELKYYGFDLNKTYFIPNCIEISRPLFDRKNTILSIQILTVARFVDQKDYPTALSTIKKLSQILLQACNFKYVIVGHGELEQEVRNTIKDHNLESIVQVIINPDDLTDYFLESDIYLSTSIFEGTSNTIMEAMSYSLPVVATNVGDNDRLVIDGQTGFLTPVKDVGTLADRLEELILSPEKRNQMGATGYQHLKENYSVDKFQQRYFELIETLIYEKKT